MNLQIETRYKVLMDPQGWHIEGVAHVFGMHQEADFTVDWNGHFRGHDVIFRISIVVLIQSIEVLVGLADLIGVNGTERTVRTGITEIKRKLSGLYLNRHGTGSGRSEVEFGPGLDAKDP